MANATLIRPNKQGDAEATLRATHGDPTRPLKIGHLEIACYVLEDGTRVITQRGLQTGLGLARSGGAHRIAKITGGLESKGLDCKDLNVRIASPIRFRSSGGLSNGYDANILVDICNTILAARKSGLLQKQQLHMADQCEVLLMAFAKVGVTALVDEATGYQEARGDKALQKLFDLFLTSKPTAWKKRFKEEYYREIARLFDWPARTHGGVRPQCVAGITKDIIYDRLAPGILDELEKLNPLVSEGTRAVKHHQFLTPNVGLSALERHIEIVTVLMSVSPTWQVFKRMLNERFPAFSHDQQRLLFRE